MKIPINNRLRAEYILPQEIIEKAYDDRLVELMNKQLMSKISEELYKSKPEIIEKETTKINYDPFQHYPFGSENYYKMQAEVFVFTKNELTELIKNIQIETSTSIREQMTIVDNFKIEECIKSIKAIELDGDWFIIPNELFEEFKEDENNEELVESGGFDDKWWKYKTGGDLNLIQLYIKQNNQLK